MLDGGGEAAPPGRISAWLVTDERAELIGDIRRLAASYGVVPRAASFRAGGLQIERRAVIHTKHPAWGYLVRWRGARVVWAPEYFRFPRWAAGADLMFAEASGWDRPIRFAAAAGGHLDTLTVARTAVRLGVRRLLFAHIGRPTIRAIDAGLKPPFGEFARDGQAFTVRATVVPANNFRRRSQVATKKQKTAARKNIKKARQVQSARARGAKIPKKSPGLSTRQENRMRSTQFAFPKERKEPLTDASHVRNAIARFDQVEGVSDSEREAAWRRIKAAAKRHGVEVTAKSWRDLMKGGRTGRS